MSCEEGWHVQRNEYAGSFDGTLMKQANMTAIGRGKDDSLIAYFEYTKKTRHLFLFSTTEKGKVWYRFMPVKMDEGDKRP